jgi:hypothetical protein
VWLIVLLAAIGAVLIFVLSSGDDDDDGAPATSAAVDVTSGTDGTEPTVPSAPTEPVQTTVADSVEQTVDTTTETLDTAPDETAATEVPTTVSGLPYELVITEQWFYPSSEGLYDYGGIIENTGSQTATGFIEIEIDFFDDAGRILSTESAFVDTVVPGLRTPFTSILIEPATAPTRMEVRLADDNFIDEDPGPVGALTFANITTADDDFTFEVSGDATSTFTEDLDFVQIVALWRDAGGAVIFSASQYLERVPAGSTTAFTITSFGDVVPRTAPTEILFVA